MSVPIGFMASLVLNTIHFTGNVAAPEGPAVISTIYFIAALAH